MKTQIDVTFGIPMFNCENYIGELIECFKTNKKINYEVIIVNDGSTDKSLDVCLSKINNKFRIINQINRGVSFARNVIIEEAKGKIVTFVDSDDLINFDNYILVIEQMIKNNIEYCINIPDERRYNIIKNLQDNVPFLIENAIINSPVNKFYNLQFLKNNNIYFDTKTSLGEDALFNMMCAFYAQKIDFISYDLYSIRTFNQNSLSRKIRINKFEELMYVNEKSQKFIKSKKEYKALEYIRALNCRSCVKDLRRLKKDLTFKEILRNIKKIKKYKKFKCYIFSTFFKNVKYYSFKFCPTFILTIYICFFK